MKKKKISKKLSLMRAKISRLSAINGGLIPIGYKTNDTRCFSRVDTCLCITEPVCNASQVACPV